MVERLVGPDVIDAFAAGSGDDNPAPLDAAFAKQDVFGHAVAHSLETRIASCALAKLVAARLQPSRSSVAVAAGHRIVHGGDRFTETCRITDEVINDMERLVQSRHRRTPAGNPDGGRRPVGLAGIEVRSRWEPCQCGSDRMAGSRVPVLVIPTDEEASIAADRLATLTSTR
ncbi:MaoC/PaaZ C-terminal domain-containing protein [Bosea sp. TND4EK4]|uniref:MaoC/PaaZ C-terminal domain-containing protein n=1 Tax=Bosea sp. TND4EK4 TaxID=1907408 RepID=UPI000970B218|nr:MaoC/PaaZ C-terminal domain-containing protein [Bosea sp. TND4EK4]